MSRLGPQARKLFEVSEKREKTTERERTAAAKKYTFILPVELMKRVKHAAIEREKTISDWVDEALREHLSRPEQT